MEKRERHIDRKNRRGKGKRESYAKRDIMRRAISLFTCGKYGQEVRNFDYYSGCIIPITVQFFHTKIIQKTKIS